MLVLVVGPSGAGKDTLLQGAAAALAEDPRYRFVRRTVTRPAAPDGEPHDSVDEAGFERLREQGGFALWWRAHGLLYGIPADIVADLARGRILVANVSRALVGEAASRFAPVRVIEVTAPADLLARRLAARGREDAVDVARRLARGIALKLPVEREILVNDGTVAQGTRRLLAALARAADAGPGGAPAGDDAPPSSVPPSIPVPRTPEPPRG